MKEKKMEEKADDEQEIKLKDYAKKSNLSPSGSINCPTCWTDLFLKKVIRDNPYDTVVGYCKKCDSTWMIRIHKVGERKKMEIWQPTEEELIEIQRGRVKDNVWAMMQNLNAIITVNANTMRNYEILGCLEVIKAKFVHGVGQEVDAKEKSRLKGENSE